MTNELSKWDDLMKLPKPRKILGRVRRVFARDPNRFLRQVSGVIHVGANSGQERETYASLGLRVVWIEPIPRVFDELKANIAQLPRQRAIQALVTDRDDEIYQFHIANNNGASSSILELKQHKDIWPDVEYVETVALASTTLPSLVRDEQIDLSAFDALIMDTQGSEMLVLKGAEPIIKHFRYVKTEVADFESYAGCCQIADLERFMTRHGFREHSRCAFAHRAQGGRYYDVTYEREV